MELLEEEGYLSGKWIKVLGRNVILGQSRTWRELYIILAVIIYIYIILVI